MTKRTIEIRELILNRYLKRYNKEMLDKLHDSYGCMDEYGYIVRCDLSCNDCFKRHILVDDIEEKDTIDKTEIAISLSELAIRCRVRFSPQKELEV